ncbi:uncharacterized protein LOC123690980 [Colias croceus]|uniref:uncharacterized protein LOC123690980 n=1 Tax=Colias crocea TaxID=72248 RepID=UPI001E27E811|nr:uncharacterized protein LOC123690980 [Colias croceus]
MKRGEKMIKMIMSKGLSENNLEKTEEKITNVSEVVVQGHISATENIEPSNIVSTSKFCEIINVEPLQTNFNSIRTPLNNLNNNVQTSNLISNNSFSDSQITPYLSIDQPGPSRIIVRTPVSDSVSEESTDVLHSKISSNIIILSESDISSDDDDSCSNSIPDSQNDFSPDDTDKDPDFLLHEDLAVSSSSEDETTTINDNTVQDENDKAKKGRKRKAVPEEWRKNKAKLLRNCGKAYISTSKSQKPMPERQMKPTCTEKCKLKCYNKINEEKRQLIFMNFWKMGDLDKQRQFINKHVTAIKPKYRYIREGSTRKDYNHAFNFEVDRDLIRVCKTFFKNTLGISDRPIRTVISMQNSIVGGFLKDDKRGKHGKHNKLDIAIIDGIKEHINSIPRIESHYCRASTSREYIEGGLSIAQLHRDYVTKCRTENVPHADYQIYYNIFTKEFNISFWSPKKDQCEDCAAYNNAEDKEPLKSKYDSHLEEKDLVRKEKQFDKENANGKCIIAVYDLQAVMPCPRGDVSNFYYISKLNVLNLTIYELGSKDVNCYVWHEGEGGRGVNEIGSCVLSYLRRLQENTKDDFEVIFYSDNCCGQQKNKYMIAMYIYAVTNLENLTAITHKFLIKGHSQNEGDSAHSVIERNISRSLKSAPIYVPEQYITLIRTAKKKGNPYRVHELNHESFFDIKKIADGVGSNYSINEDREKVKMGDIKVIRVGKIHNDRFFYKCSFKEDSFKTVLVKTRASKIKKNLSSEIQPLYSTKLPVSDSKKAGILTLIDKNIIPRFYKNFYENL